MKVAKILKIMAVVGAIDVFTQAAFDMPYGVFSTVVSFISPTLGVMFYSINILFIFYAAAGWGWDSKLWKRNSPVGKAQVKTSKKKK